MVCSLLHAWGYSLRDVAADLLREIEFIALCLFLLRKPYGIAFKTPYCRAFPEILGRHSESDLLGGARSREKISRFYCRDTGNSVRLRFGGS